MRGYTRSYEESLSPAFAQRGWGIGIIDCQRRRMALHHAAYCISDLFSAAEREELIELLLRLGDSPALRCRLLALRLGAGSLI